MAIEAYKPREINAQDYRRHAEHGDGYNYIGPNNVILQVNYGCYLHCVPCDRWKWIDGGYDERNILSTEELVSLYVELATMGTSKITMVGTEPVKRKDFKTIVTAIREQGIKPEIFTAGIILTEQNLTAIIDSQSDVSISMDGFRPETHNNIRYAEWRTISGFNPYQLAIESIQRIRQAREAKGLSANNIHIFANITLQKDNIRDLETAGAVEIDSIGADSLRIAIAHGKGSFVLTSEDTLTIIDFMKRVRREKPTTNIDLSDAVKYILDVAITAEDFDRNILIPSRYISGDSFVRCRISDFSTVIAPNGDVYPCLYLYGDNLPLDYSRDDFKIGNIREKGSFASVWNSKKYAVFRNGKYPDLDCQNGCGECTKCEYFQTFVDLQNILDGSEDKLFEIGW